jgi:hypothetical protein
LSSGKLPTGCDLRWVVVVTHGTKPWQAYAVVPSEQAAQILAGKAAEHGYRNPEVMTQRKYLIGRKYVAA